MTQERFTVVALPYSRDDSSPFHVSLFISPQLTPSGPEEPLEAFEAFVQWTNQVRSSQIELRNQSGVIEAHPIFDELDVDAWASIFPPDTPVRGRQQLDWSTRYWRTFRAAEVQNTAKLISAVAVAASPIVPGVPDIRLDPLVALVNGILDLPDDLSNYDERNRTARSDADILEPSVVSEVVSLARVE